MEVVKATTRLLLGEGEDHAHAERQARARQGNRRDGAGPGLLGGEGRPGFLHPGRPVLIGREARGGSWWREPP
jgi:hypothetical protein